MIEIVARQETKSETQANPSLFFVSLRFRSMSAADSYLAKSFFFSSVLSQTLVLSFTVFNRDAYEKSRTTNFR